MALDFGAVDERRDVPADEVPFDGRVEGVPQDNKAELNRSRGKANFKPLVYERLDVLGRQLGKSVPAERG